MDNGQRDDTVVDILVRRFIADHPTDAAAKLDQIERSEAAQILAAIPVENMVGAWEAMNANSAAETLLEFDTATRRALASRTDIGKLALVLSRMEEDECDRILSDMDAADAADVRAILEFPQDTAGRLMDTRVLTFKKSQSVAETIGQLRKRRRRKGVSELRIVDDDKKLIGLVDIRDLALADDAQTLGDLMRGVTAVVLPMDPKDDVVGVLEKYGLDELPVVDRDGVLLGIIRHSELINALRETVTLDVQTMVGASKDERATSTSWFAIRRRMPWLQINLLTAFLAAAVVGLFEGTIAKVTALAVLLPVVAGQSGNAGAQALAVTMRGLALREIRVSNWLGVLRKEMNAGFWNGVGIAVTCSIGVYIWSNSVGLVLVIAVSMVISMVAAGIAGALVPITLSRLGQDPAVASSIVLTTITDIAGFFSFLGIATLLMGMLVQA